MDEAEDVVQEAYLRWHQAPRPEIRSPEAWLVTVTTRAAVDRLRRVKAERQRYVGPWLPEPIPGEPESSGAPPDRPAELASDLSVALLVLLESLAPEERAAFLLREVFGSDYGEIARILGRREDAVRQMVHRARRRVRAGRPRVAVPQGEHARILERFVSALAADDPAALLAVLAPDVTVTTDGGGAVTAARRRIEGADRASRFLIGVTRKLAGQTTWRLGRLNGQPAMLSFAGDTLQSITVLEVDGGLVRGVYSVLNPAKLRRAAAEPVRIE